MFLGCLLLGRRLANFYGLSRQTRPRSGRLLNVFVNDLKNGKTLSLLQLVAVSKSTGGLEVTGPSVCTLTRR